MNVDSGTASEGIFFARRAGMAAGQPSTIEVGSPASQSPNTSPAGERAAYWPVWKANCDAAGEIKSVGLRRCEDSRFPC